MTDEFPFHRIETPKFRPRITEILKIGATDQKVLVVVGNRIHWFGSHWTGSHTAPCMADRKQCENCKKKVPWKQVGFLHVHEAKTSCHYFLEMTDYAGAEFLKVQGKRETPRGMTVAVSRVRKTIRSPLCFADLGDAPEAKLAKVAERDPIATLKVIWKIA